MIRLSPSSLSDFKKCPLLFWLDKHHDLKMPRGAFPSLPGGMDRVLKGYYDRHREAGVVPQELLGKIPATLGLFKDQAQLKKWRFWKSGLAVDLGAGRVVSGALDDLLYDPAADLYAVIDYKTRGAIWKPGATEEYYGTQADTYDLMLTANGRKTTGKAYFAYYWPKDTIGATAAATADVPARVDFSFDADVVQIATDTARAGELAIKAFECLEGPMPELRDGDEVSDWLVAVLERLGYTRTAGQVAEAVQVAA